MENNRYCRNCGHGEDKHGAMGACDGCDDRCCSYPAFDQPIHCLKQFKIKVSEETHDDGHQETVWERRICFLERGHEGDHWMPIQAFPQG